jgi:hypothetical protein
MHSSSHDLTEALVTTVIKIRPIVQNNHAALIGTTAPILTQSIFFISYVTCAPSELDVLLVTGYSLSISTQKSKREVQNQLTFAPHVLGSRSWADASRSVIPGASMGEAIATVASRVARRVGRCILILSFLEKVQLNS